MAADGEGGAGHGARETLRWIWGAGDAGGVGAGGGPSESISSVGWRGH